MDDLDRLIENCLRKWQEEKERERYINLTGQNARLAHGKLERHTEVREDNNEG